MHEVHLSSNLSETDLLNYGSAMLMHLQGNIDQVGGTGGGGGRRFTVNREPLP
jgi:hypothetical protein